MAARRALRLGAGVLPASLVAWELGASYRRRKKAQDEVAGAVKFPEGSLEWTIENEVNTLDLVLTRRSPWKLGPLRGLASAVAPGQFDSVGVVVKDDTGYARVLEADLDGSASATPLSSKMRDADAVEMVIRPLAWPRDERDRVEAKANLFAAKAMLTCAADRNALSVPFAAAADERFAPAWRPRGAWPGVQAAEPLEVKLQRAVSPAAGLVLELYVELGLVPPQHRGQPMLADDWDHEPPLRKGARFGPPVPIKVANAS